MKFTPFTLIFTSLLLIALAASSFGRSYVGSYNDYFLIALIAGVLWYLYEQW